VLIFLQVGEKNQRRVGAEAGKERLRIAHLAENVAGMAGLSGGIQPDIA
jgi:hypothetical protein